MHESPPEPRDGYGRGVASLEAYVAKLRAEERQRQIDRSSDHHVRERPMPPLGSKPEPGPFDELLARFGPKPERLRVSYTPPPDDETDDTDERCVTMPPLGGEGGDDE